MTAIADAALDSISLVAITGQVASSMMGTDAFQEVDIYGMTVSVTKHNFLVRSARELLTVVPKDVQNVRIEIEALPAPAEAEAPPPIDRAALATAAAMINASQRPVLYLAGGVIHSGAGHEVVTLAGRCCRRCCRRSRCACASRGWRRPTPSAAPASG